MHRSSWEAYHRLMAHNVAVVVASWDDRTMSVDRMLAAVVDWTADVDVAQSTHLAVHQHCHPVPCHALVHVSSYRCSVDPVACTMTDGPCEAYPWDHSPSWVHQEEDSHVVDRDAVEIALVVVVQLTSCACSLFESAVAYMPHTHTYLCNRGKPMCSARLARASVEVAHYKISSNIEHNISWKATTRQSKQ